MASSIIACIAASGAQPAHAATLQVTVKGIRNGNGTVNICVFNSEQGFPDCSKSPALIGQKQSASAGSLRFNFDINPGLHAVSVLHDENNNGRLDTSVLGIPREGVGVSNNPQPRWGPPTFAEAAFTLSPQGGDIIVNVVYP